MLGAANQGPVGVIIVLSIVVPLVLLGIVVWVFWRAKKKEDAERERAAAPDTEAG